MYFFAVVCGCLHEEKTIARPSDVRVTHTRTSEEEKRGIGVCLLGFVGQKRRDSGLRRSWAGETRDFGTCGTALVQVRLVLGSGPSLGLGGQIRDGRGCRGGGVPGRGSRRLVAIHAAVHAVDASEDVAPLVTGFDQSTRRHVDDVSVSGGRQVSRR